MNSHLRYQREEIVGVIPPPPGIVPNFDNPPSMKTTLVVVDVTLIVISTVFVVLRLYTAQFILRRVNIPDCKCPARNYNITSLLSRCNYGRLGTIFAAHISSELS